MSSPLSDAVPLAELKRVLVTKLRHHGDVLLASPVVSTLKAVAPHAEVDALVYRDTAPMLEGHPALARLHTIDRAWKREGLLRQLSAERALARDLAARRYDLLVHLTEHPRGIALARRLKPRWAVTTAQVTERGAAWLWKRHYTHFYRLPRATERPMVEQNLDALRRIGIEPPEEARGLVMVPGAQAEAKVDALLASRGLARGAFVQAHPGSRWFFKCWPADRVAALVERIVADGLPVVLTAAPDGRERALLDAIRAQLSPAAAKRVADLGGMLSLRELAALTARARLFVGVDSAPMHIAAAVGTPVVALFGPSSEIAWGPWRVPSRVVTSAHPCRPCGLDGCGGSKVSECLTTLPVERVHAAVRELLEDTVA
ncbi:MAG: putative lipopolysaccharide heptosyltransferase III [Burkholderiales bacterium]|nr:putative lipopolysaccharide heptosyltransferase III [Burkholderiales bacterium]